MEGSYDLELAKVTETIQKREAKRVLIQLPDGLKPQAKMVADHIKKTTGAESIIWMGSCFGACDIPVGLEALDIDLIVQWGHNLFHKLEEGW